MGKEWANVKNCCKRFFQEHLKKIGFEERIRGDHYILIKDNVEEIINIQPKNSKAKGYQVKQIRNLIVKYRLGDSDVD